jgi:hypothetical protein
VLWTLGIPEADRFRDWYAATLDELCRQEGWTREPWWSTAFALGDRTWLGQFTGGEPECEEHVRPLDPDTADQERRRRRSGPGLNINKWRIFSGVCAYEMEWKEGACLRLL